MSAAIDLNCDLGEGADNDAALMPLITSANIACGGHAGDEASMRAAVRLALRHGVAVGAHPGFADREHFGRRELTLPAHEIVAQVRGQVEALLTIATDEGAVLTHVKPHGALYNLAARDAAVAEAVAEAVASVDGHLWIYGLAGSKLPAAGRARGLRVAEEVFADRTYQADGSLTPRNRPDALVSSANAAIKQVLRMVRESQVHALDGTVVPITADTLCLHGDGAHAVEFARGLRDALRDNGIAVRALARPRG
jgi:5-oxoprolinase (ATP-hydrolysing) subunit A